MSDNFITIEDIINANRSPPLSPARVTYRHTETPPPGLDLEVKDTAKPLWPATTNVNVLCPIPQPCRPQPSLSDSLLINFLGPNYPELAVAASRELIPSPLEVDRETQKPLLAFTHQHQMVSEYAKPVSHESGGTQFIAVAAFEASQKLNAAIGSSRTSSNQTSLYLNDLRSGERRTTSNEMHDMQPKSPSPVDHIMDTRSPVYHAQKALNVRPPPRISLPSIRTTSPGSGTSHHHRREQSIATSPVLAKYTLTAVNRDPDQQLPRMQISPTLPLSSISNVSRQTLPSLETALSAISAPADVTFSGHSPSLNRTSPGQMSYFGPSPSSYSNASPASTISPPRLPTAPSYWRTTSRETTHSTSSEHASATTSNGVSTPASSVPGLSPSHSAHTPAANDHELRHSDDATILQGMTPRQGDDAQYSGVFGTGSFRCTFPNCNAQPFQTQYLLNSHANVHSNTRPHFCPVENCPRGPGGQGFKRKNEMIRHGLVHQSPGYVCPFCPDQQHKYPRPDNLQRHVRVHHVDRDRDDPMLREVLAQRPEGGNRGRRRRLGS